MHCCFILRILTGSIYQPKERNHFGGISSSFCNISSLQVSMSQITMKYGLNVFSTILIKSNYYSLVLKVLEVVLSNLGIRNEALASRIS